MTHMHHLDFVPERAEFRKGSVRVCGDGLTALAGRD